MRCSHRQLIYVAGQQLCVVVQHSVVKVRAQRKLCEWWHCEGCEVSPKNDVMSEGGKAILSDVLTALSKYIGRTGCEI